VERYNRILAEEFLHARTWTSEQERSNACSALARPSSFRRLHSVAPDPVA
jgi:hypothetical protein